MQLSGLILFQKYLVFMKFGIYLLWAEVSAIFGLFTDLFDLKNFGNCRFFQEAKMLLYFYFGSKVRLAAMKVGKCLSMCQRLFRCCQILSLNFFLQAGWV